MSRGIRRASRAERYLRQVAALPCQPQTTFEVIGLRLNNEQGPGKIPGPCPILVARSRQRAFPFGIVGRL